MEVDEYICELCHQTYKKGWTDKEAIEESLYIFGEYQKEDVVVVCDDCWKANMT